MSTGHYVSNFKLITQRWQNIYHTQIEVWLCKRKDVCIVLIYNEVYKASDKIKARTFISMYMVLFCLVKLFSVM